MNEKNYGVKLSMALLVISGLWLIICSFLTMPYAPLAKIYALKISLVVSSAMASISMLLAVLFSSLTSIGSLAEESGRKFTSYMMIVGVILLIVSVIIFTAAFLAIPQKPSPVVD